MKGYAWAGVNGSGWISVNCKTGGPGGADICGTSNYNLRINNNMTITGYAWSGALGWIKFGGLSGFPDAGGNARIDPTTNKITGWARICGGTRSGNPADGDISGTCGTMDDNTHNDWDGWISLNCENTGDCDTSNYGLEAGNGYIKTSARYAWGADPVGWTDWRGVSWDMPCDPGLACVDGVQIRTDQWCNETPTGRSCTLPPAETRPELVDFTVDPQVVRSGGSTNISWEVKNVTSCIVEGTNGDSWNSPITGTSTAFVDVASPVVSSSLTFATEFFISCYDLNDIGPVELARKSVRILPGYVEI